MGHHGPPLSVGAASRGSHFVLVFHFQRPSGPLTFMPLNESVMQAPTNQAWTKMHAKKPRICVDSTRCTVIMHLLCFLPLWILLLLLLLQGGCASGESNACLKLHHGQKKRGSGNRRIDLTCYSDCRQFFCYRTIRRERRCPPQQRLWWVSRREILLLPALFRVSPWPLVSHRASFKLMVCVVCSSGMER